MTDQQKIDSTDARKAFMEGIISSTTAMDSTPAEPASEAPETEKSAEKVEEKAEGKSKKTAQERIIDLAHQRKEAEQRERDVKRENDELRMRLKALEASVTPIDVPKEPRRQDFMSEEQYVNALTDFKVDKRIAEREEVQRQAKLAAETQEIEAGYLKTVAKARQTYEDFSEVLAEAKDVNVPPFLVMAIKESEVGGDLIYYLAKFPDETKRILAMRPVQALKYLTHLERELILPEEPTSAEKAKPAAKKAPEPISPVRGTNLSDMSTPAKNFEEYRARRQAELKSKRR